jgi:hypothetical protein
MDEAWKHYAMWEANLTEPQKILFIWNVKNRQIMESK